MVLGVIFVAALLTTGVLAFRNVLPQWLKITGVVLAIIFVLLASMLIILAIAGGVKV